MTDSLGKLIVEASVLAGTPSCSNGHTWESNGGRACPYDFVDAETGEYCAGQTVYECIVCGDIDYGEPGGPAFTECDNCPTAEAKQ